MNIGLYGGTFDPLHFAHLIVAQFIKEELKLDKILFIPSGIPPHKETFAPKSLRLKMVQLSIEGNPDFACSDIEIRKEATSYSVGTIEELSAELQLSHQNLFWIIGSDNFIDFPKWKNPQRILQLCTVVVFPRTGDDFERAPTEFRGHPSIRLINAPILQISSTRIRSLVKEKRSIRYLVPPAVESIIDSHELYR